MPSFGGNSDEDRYYWYGMYKDVEHWVRSCVDCATRKTPKNKLRAPLVPLAVEGAFEAALGPLPLSTSGNRYVIVLSDYLTHWPEAFAVPYITAETVTRLLLDEIIPCHSAPRTLLSDRGTNFLSALVREICKLFQIRKVNCSAYHPQTNGVVK